MATKVTLAAAEAVIAAAKARAEELGQPMNIAVVDAGARLVAFARMDESILASIDISQKKAVTSMMMKLPTIDLAEVSQPGAPLFGLEHVSGGLITFAGGVPLLSRGKPVGAIGVSAGTVEQDHDVATAGADAFKSA